MQMSQRNLGKLWAVMLSSYLSLLGCGGGGGGDVDAPIQGIWSGKTTYDPSSCGPVSLLPHDISGESYTFTVFDAKNDLGPCPVKAEDQNRRKYFLNFPDRCELRGESEIGFGADADFIGDQNSLGLVYPSAPSGIVFRNITEHSADVSITFFVDRFCTFVFRGKFSR